MIRQRHIFLALAIVLALLSCGQRRNASTNSTATPQEPLDTTVHLSLGELPFLSSTDSLAEFRLCDQVLTSEDGISRAFDNAGGGSLHESTSIDKTFYYPDKDIADNDLAVRTQLFYNYVSVLNRVIHSYEWFNRMSTNESGQASRARKRQWIKQSCPHISSSTLSRAIPDQNKRQSAKKLLAAYAAYDGNELAGNAFYDAVDLYREEGNDIPVIVDLDKSDDFEKIFWPWYDKNKVVPGIDEVIKLNLSDYTGEKLSEEQLTGLRHSIESEKDIDRRTIMALEYVKFDRQRGVVFLGEILESGIYTKYLLEAWISWRANVQMDHSPSSFTVIPNNYYDQLRVKCIDTMVRHCIQENDPNAQWLLVNLIYAEIVHRMGSIAGNSSFNTAAELNLSEFIHPRLIET